MTDIFTDADETIFYEGSIDPMGLRMIWTSLGNRIFGNKLNTISTDIRFYTLNLFHHHVIYQIEKELADRILNITGREPYNTKIDLRDGLIIFLESLLVQAFDMLGNENESETIMNVPGIMKFKGLKLHDSGNSNVRYLFVDKKKGILVRHILLGIHGRYKGPFRQMDIFGDRDYYLNTQIWNEASKLFSVSPWSELANELRGILKNWVLVKSRASSKPIRVNTERILSERLIEAYRSIKNPVNYTRKSLVEFWEDRLGLHSGIAGILYASVKNAKESDSYENILRVALRSSDQNHSGCLAAICAIEPFLACMDMMFRRISRRGTIDIDKDLVQFAEHWLRSNAVSPENISKFLSEEFMDSQALFRLKKLLSIYSECIRTNDSKLFIRSIIDYHKNLMESRGKFPWISIGIKGNITQHRSTKYGEDESKAMKETTWVNNYYLPTLESLYKGLHKS